VLRAAIKPLAIALAVAFLASDTPASAQSQAPARIGIGRVARELAVRAAASAQPAAPPSLLTVLTFNAGLAPGAVALSAERAPRVVEALRNEPFDILCAQEVWLEEDFVALRSALADRAPHVVRSPAEQVPGPSCEPPDVALLEACHRGSCADAAGGKLADCMVARCAHLALSLPSDCVACLTREPWKRIADARLACAVPEASRAPGNARPDSRPGSTPAVKPLVGPGSAPLAFGGSDGVVLASRRPFSSTATLRLPSAYSQRVVHHARFEASPIGPLDVFCTHLSATLGQMPHPGRGTWDEEHATQVGALVEWIDQRTRGVKGATIVAGDLNMGPHLPGRADARRGAQLERILAAGFVAPYVANRAARCTYCNDNPLAGGAPGRAGGALLDHVLLRGVPGRVDVARVLDGSVHPHPLAQPLSDHYGLAATLGASKAP
jgi:endonuclease/exonuclease/phosphatase family metal-dependent hydrolase